MKYIITDKDEARVGGGYHIDLARDCEGKVVRAGHCEENADGTFRVFGGSMGYNILSKPEDAELLLDLLKEHESR